MNIALIYHPLKKRLQNSHQNSRFKIAVLKVFVNLSLSLGFGAHTGVKPSIFYL
jgi:hypothetical protein